MSQRSVEVLNCFLVVGILFVAYQFPFRLFLYAYALLGPLHYLTEISWLDGKRYFQNNQKWLWVGLLFAVGLFIPKMAFYEPITKEFSNWVESPFIQFFGTWSNAFIFIPFCAALAYLLIPNWFWRAVAMLVIILTAYFLNDVSIYIIWIGVLLPTVIHVYFFTLSFIWYGQKKSKSVFGFANIALMIAVPIVIALIDIDPKSYHFAAEVKQMFTESKFYLVVAKLGLVLGVADGAHFYFYEVVFLKLQIFIAFAYTYHYLNWFSKTTLIGWHTQIKSAQWLVIIPVCAIMSALFWVDYALGILASFLVSFVHVFLEFPLNIKTLKALFTK